MVAGEGSVGVQTPGEQDGRAGKKGGRRGGTKPLARSDHVTVDLPPLLLAHEAQRQRFFPGHAPPFGLERPLSLEVGHVFLHQSSSLFGLTHPPQTFFFLTATPFFL